MLVTKREHSTFAAKSVLGADLRLSPARVRSYPQSGRRDRCVDRPLVAKTQNYSSSLGEQLRKHKQGWANYATLTVDEQFITNPAYNADRGPVHIFFSGPLTRRILI